MVEPVEQTGMALSEVLRRALDARRPPSQGLGLLHLTEQGRSDADRVLASQVLPRCHQEPDVPQAGAQIVSPGAGAAIVTISWMTCRGVLN